MPSEEEWETTEISLAAYLALELEADPEYSWDGSSCYFVFSKSPELAALVVKFTGGEALVEPRIYHMKTSSLKTNMFRANPDRRLRKPQSMFRS